MFLTEHWGSPEFVSRGHLHYADQLPGFIAWANNEPVGVITYHIAGIQCEIVTVNSLLERQGIGKGLIDAVKKTAEKISCKRVWLITTNDNTPALVFYQKMGFRLAVLHKDSIKKSRKLKPEIPQTGLDGIPIRDEIELELWLD